MLILRLNKVYHNLENLEKAIKFNGLNKKSSLKKELHLFQNVEIKFRQ
jgi:hypothetical protein